MMDLDRLILLTIHDKEHNAKWLERWECSYPSCLRLECSANQNIVDWQKQLQTAFNDQEKMDFMVVMYGAGAIAFLAWLYQSDILIQKRIKGAILVSPDASSWQEDNLHSLSKARASFPCVIVEPKSVSYEQKLWSENLAEQLNAKLLFSPHQGQLDGHLNGWQWGMKLMQEILMYGQ